MQFFILLAKQPSITFRSCWKVSVQITRWWTRTVRVLQKGNTQVNANKLLHRFYVGTLHDELWCYTRCLHHFCYVGLYQRFLRKVIGGPFECKLFSWSSCARAYEMLSEQLLLSKGDRSQMGCTVLHRFSTWYFGTNFNCQFFPTILQCWVRPNVPRSIL